ncbi:MAG: hypothetical protein M3R46_07655 [Actinomycetota bacterium]|nr:hypothetical protein [Actinomycetota bacterium]
MAVTHRVQAPEINPMRISLDRYHAFIEAGLFEDGVRGELLEGVLVAMSRPGRGAGDGSRPGRRLRRQGPHGRRSRWLRRGRS